VAAILIIGFLLFEKKYFQEPPLLSLRVGTVSAEHASLIFIAEQQGFFRDNGLTVVTTDYQLGADAFKALLRDEIDIAPAAEFIGVTNSFNRQDFKIIGTMMESVRVFQLVGRKDHGIATLPDLKGKRIGVSKNTVDEFFLKLFLKSNNIETEDIIKIDGRASGFVEAVDSGIVDAVVILNPYAYTIKQKLGENAIVFPIQNNETMYRLLFAKSSFLELHPKATRRFMQALVHAEQFINNNPESLKKLLIEKYAYSEDYVNEALPLLRFRVVLDNSILRTMEHEAQWQIENNLTSVSTVPNYFDFIYRDALAAVKPEAVSITR
jgi:NitT/TauT family transport system substrate-binding protein